MHAPILTLMVLFHVVLVTTTAFFVRNNLPVWQVHAYHSGQKYNDGRISASTTTKASSSSSSETARNIEQNNAYIEGLMSNLGELCDKYILNGSPKIRERVFNVLDQIAAEAVDDQLIRQSVRMVKRAGVPMHKTYLEKFQNNYDEFGKTDAEERRREAMKRKEWERNHQQLIKTEYQSTGGKSALSRRMEGASGTSDPFLPSVLDPDSIATIAKDKDDFQRQMQTNDINHELNSVSHMSVEEAYSRVSEVIAKAGAGDAFIGQTLGIGGLDDVLLEIKRRIWTPLAAPPRLLEELGIHPVRGLLLYGKPGCGKTLLASTLGSILSPFRPITVVSGPEILDKFVGSSEKNLRNIFDEPPPIYDNYGLGEADGGNALSKAALHVVVMDEFDAIARSRGGSDGKGGQGDAGVARDSVVNQLLAKLDGVQPLPVPTLVIGLTNKRSLIEPALLRPGRFEVQIEIPPPRTVAQRVSILKVHTKHMYVAGRLQVNDPPPGTAAALQVQEHNPTNLLSYEDLLERLAIDCGGFSGAALAGVARAAASHALERSVNEFSKQLENAPNGSLNSGRSPSILDCCVTQEDFYDAIKDIRNSMGTHDHSEDLIDDASEDEPDDSGEN